MKFKDYIYLLFSYSNLSNIKINYPNFKTVALINIIAFIIYVLVENFLFRGILVVVALLINLCFKETRGIVITFSTITTWVFLFTSAKAIPDDWRRSIDVTTLYNWESKFDLFCFKFYKDDNTFLDLLAWLPYGIVHYAMPIITGICLMIWYKPGYVSTYLFFFGLMNTIGVITQLSWPTAPPWYYRKYETMPANYTMHGDPAGLERIDDLFGLNLYTSSFTSNPLPWGAWPSLHSGFATFTATFLSFLFPKFCLLFILYVAWIWWATMYLGHHYFVDVLGGFGYAMVTVIPAILILKLKKPVNEDYEELKSILYYGESESKNNGQGMENSNSGQRYDQGGGSMEEGYFIDSEQKLIGTSSNLNNLKVDRDGLLSVVSYAESDGGLTDNTKRNSALEDNNFRYIEQINPAVSDVGTDIGTAVAVASNASANISNAIVTEELETITTTTAQPPKNTDFTDDITNMN